MVYPREEKLEKLSQEEIISNTKLVIQGLEALKNEHNSILHSLLETIKCLKKDEEANLVHEKSNLLRKSVEMIELGLGEAQVRIICQAMNRGKPYFSIKDIVTKREHVESVNYSGIILILEFAEDERMFNS